MPAMVYERSPGSWGARVTLAGAQVWLGTHSSREAAEEAVRRAKRGVLPSTMTVGEWGARWQVVYPGRGNAETRAHDAQMVAPFVRLFAQRRLDSIRPHEAQIWTLKHPSQARYLRRMFAKAKKAGIIRVNVWDDVEPPDGIPRRARRSPTTGEVETLVGAARRRYGDRVADMIVFTAYTGVRLSEMADAQAGDLHQDGRRLRVRGKRRAGDTEPRERTVLVCPQARAAWEAHAPGVGVVWRSVQGRRWTRRTVAEMMRTVCDIADVDDVTFHSLRHFHASWLLDQGASDMDVALQLGHQRLNGTVDPGLVRRVYGHPDVEAGLRRLEAVAA